MGKKPNFIDWWMDKVDIRTMEYYCTIKRKLLMYAMTLMSAKTSFWMIKARCKRLNIVWLLLYEMSRIQISGYVGPAVGVGIINKWAQGNFSRWWKGFKLESGDDWVTKVFKKSLNYALISCVNFMSCILYLNKTNKNLKCKI